MNKMFVFVVFIAVIFGAGFWYKNSIGQPKEKIYVAVEGDGLIAVIDAKKQKVLKSIDLSVEHDGGKLIYAPHNVQVSPNNKSVWVTANASKHEGHTRRFVPEAYAHGDEAESVTNESDQIIVIDPLTDKIIKRIPIKQNIHLAHVVVTKSGDYAYATAQKEGVIYKINTKTFEVEKNILARKDGEPHGLRISPDDSFAYIAALKSKALGILDLKNDEYREVFLEGSPVQAGVTPNNKYAFVSLYDTKRLAVYEIKSEEVDYVDLPPEAKGAIQMYSTPDSRFVYLADQGYYFGQPVGERVYKIDLLDKKVVKEIKTGLAPHGVIVSEDGQYVYITNLLGEDVSVIETKSDTLVNKIKVGREPNGISLWYKNSKQ